VRPIDALPSHPDTTTARRPLPQLAPGETSDVFPVGPLATSPSRPVTLDGRAAGERSGEIIIDRVTPAGQLTVPPSGPAEIVIEIDALTEEDMLAESLEAAFAEAAVTQDFVAAGPVLGLADGDTQAIELHPAGFGSDEADEKTEPGPLRPRKRSG
jgi:hypothetical protein